MTEPDGQQEPEGPDEDPDEAGEVYEPHDHPHPLRAQDCQALIRKEIG